MGTALIVTSRLAALVPALFKRTLPTATRPPRLAVQTPVPVKTADSHSRPSSLSCQDKRSLVGQERGASCAGQPRKTIRIYAPGGLSAVGGRMVISGTMADVCAELDRLAAREAMAL